MVIYNYYILIVKHFENTESIKGKINNAYSSSNEKKALPHFGPFSPFPYVGRSFWFFKHS